MKDPTKARARRTTKQLICNGEIPVTPCRECGAPIVEAHHTDYADPRAVVFLCRGCHMRTHSGRQAFGYADTPVGRMLNALQGDETQVQFARRLGVDQPEVSKLLSGARRPGRRMIVALLRTFPDRHADIVAVLTGESDAMTAVASQEATVSG